MGGALPWWAEYAVEKTHEEPIEELVKRVGSKLGITAAFRRGLRPTGLQYIVLQGERQAFNRALLSHLTIRSITKADAGLYWRMALGCGPTFRERLGYGGRALLIKLGLGSSYDELIAHGWIQAGTHIPSELHVLQWYSQLKQVPKWSLAGIGLEVGASVVADVAVQWWFDKDDPYLTPVQKNWRLAVAGAGGFVSGVAGILALPAGPWASFGVAAGVELVWQNWVTPIIYEGGGLLGERRLRPLDGGG